MKHSRVGFFVVVVVVKEDSFRKGPPVSPALLQTGKANLTPSAGNLR